MGRAGAEMRWMQTLGAKGTTASTTPLSGRVGEYTEKVLCQVLNVLDTLEPAL